MNADIRSRLVPKKLLRVVVDADDFFAEVVEINEVGENVEVVFDRMTNPGGYFSNYSDPPEFERVSVPLKAVKSVSST